MKKSDVFLFNWGVDPTGYSVEEVDMKGEEDATLLTGRGTFTALRRMSPDQELRLYCPVEETPNLHWDFGRLENTVEAARGFVNAHGVLGRSGLSNKDFGSVNDDQEIDEFFSAQKEVQGVMELLEHGRATEKSPAIAFNKSCAARMAIMIDPQNSQRPMLKIIPTTLLSYIWLRVSEDVTRGVQWKKCKYEQCSNHFAVGRGAGTKRREFCRDQNCKVYYHRHKQKKPSDG